MKRKGKLRKKRRLKTKNKTSPSKACTLPLYLKLLGECPCSRISRLWCPNRKCRTWLRLKCSHNSRLSRCNSSCSSNSLASSSVSFLLKCRPFLSACLPSKTTSLQTRVSTEIYSFNSSNSKHNSRFYCSSKNFLNLKNRPRKPKMKALHRLLRYRQSRKNRLRTTSQTLLWCARRIYPSTNNSTRASKSALSWTNNETWWVWAKSKSWK